MARAEQEDTKCAGAITYRDGLLVASLAARPICLRNLVGLVLDRTLVARGTRWWIEFPAPETKTNNAVELPWPEALIAALRPFARHRHALANMRGGSPRPVGDALWVSSKGSPMTRSGIYWCITKRTRDAFGHSISPHLFRDCAATSIAIDDPQDPASRHPCLAIVRLPRPKNIIIRPAVSKRPGWCKRFCSPCATASRPRKSQACRKGAYPAYGLLPRIGAGHPGKPRRRSWSAHHHRGAGCRCRRQRNCRRRESEPQDGRTLASRSRGRPASTDLT